MKTIAIDYCNTVRDVNFSHTRCRLYTPEKSAMTRLAIKPPKGRFALAPHLSFHDDLQTYSVWFILFNRFYKN